MPHTLDPVAERALAINLDPAVYGSFAEIGAGQEVARWFFSVGGAAGTVAKTISAYDMTFSDAIYGKAKRYVSRERVEEMLDHEYRLLLERLEATRGDRTRFFAFADTAAARSYSGGHECHAWLGVRFQHALRAGPSDVILHVRLLDPSHSLQQEAIGRLGVNLLHAAVTQWREPKVLVGRLLDDVDRERLEIDWILVRGPAFAGVDNRLLDLHLVRLGFTPAVLFDIDGTPLLASEAIRHAHVLIERGQFAPVTRLNLEMLALARVDLLSAVKKMVLVSDLPAFYSLGEYLAERSVARTGFVLGVPLLRELFNENFYADLAGGILEAFGRLFTRRVRLYVHATRDAVDGRVVTADSLRVSPHLTHLLEHLRDNGLLHGLPCDDATLHTYSSEDVRQRICSGDPSWKQLVAAEVAAHIDTHGISGFTCEM